MGFLPGASGPGLLLTFTAWQAQGEGTRAGEKNGDSMALHLRKLSYALGAEVIGLDLSQPMSAEAIAEIRAAWLEHMVLLFRDQRLTPEQHIAFTAHFGPQEPYLFHYQQHPDYPVINLLSNMRGDGYKPEPINRGTEWHSDLSFSARPAEASLLYCREAPEVGGNTIFANMAMAYERLSPLMQRIIDPLYSVHALFGKDYTAQNRANSAQMQEMIDKAPPIAQPMVLTHTETGRKALYVHESVSVGIVGLADFEATPLLDMLFRHSERIEFTWRHQWQKGDLLMWDNRSVMHQEVPDNMHRELRLLNRTTVIGPPRGAVVPADRAGWDPARADPARQVRATLAEMPWAAGRVTASNAPLARLVV